MLGAHADEVKAAAKLDEFWYARGRAARSGPFYRATTAAAVAAERAAVVDAARAEAEASEEVRRELNEKLEHLKSLILGNRNGPEPGGKQGRRLQPRRQRAGAGTLFAASNTADVPGRCAAVGLGA